MAEEIEPGNPLSKLFTSKYNYTSLQYPSDLNSSGKGHAVVFRVSEVDSVGINQVNKWLTEGVNTGIEKGKQAYAAAQAIKNDPMGAGRNLISAAEGLVTKGIESTEKYINEKGGVINGFTAALDDGLTTIAAQKTTISEFLANSKTEKETVYLYMPEAIEFSYAANYDETSVMDIAASAPIVGRIASGINSVLDNKAARFALKKMGYAFNPQAQMLFQGIDFRSYSMSFSFIPRSAKEAAQIQKIIKTFRTYAAPETVNEAAGFFFKPPGIFNVEFTKDGQINKNIGRVYDSVLKSIDINYGPNGWSAHKDGHPTEITMTLQFQEIVLVDRQTIRSEYN